MKQTKFLNLRLKAFKPLPSLVLGVLLSSYGSSAAQEVVISSGGDITSTTGSVSYSVGQITQNTITDGDTTVLQGIQFYIDDNSLSIVDVDTKLEITTFPNPASSNLNITINDFKPNLLSYKLFNTLGQLIEEGNITGKTTSINVSELDIATYLLKIENTDKKTSQTFKIIKN